MSSILEYGLSKGDHLKSYVVKRFYAVAKSHDTFHQIPLDRKEQYKQVLIDLHGQVCDSRFNFGCGKIFDPGELTIDHIIEIALGGPVEDLGNMQLLCVRCHTKKTEDYDKQLIRLH